MSFASHVYDETATPIEVNGDASPDVNSYESFMGDYLIGFRNSNNGVISTSFEQGVSSEDAFGGMFVRFWQSVYSVNRRLAISRTATATDRALLLVDSVRH